MSDASPIRHTLLVDYADYADRRRRYITITWDGVTSRLYLRRPRMRYWTALPGCGWRHRRGGRRC